MEMNPTADNPGMEPTVPAAPAVPTTEPTVEPSAPVIEPAAPKQPDIAGTKSFSERLNAAKKDWEQEHGQKFRYASELERIAKGLGHSSVEAYLEVQDKVFLERDAEKRGIDPEVLAQMNANERAAQEAKAKASELENRVNQYERREALTKLATEFPVKNPKWAEFFNANRGDIMELANAMTGDGLTVDEHLEAAMMQVFKDKWEPPKPVDEQAIIEKYKASLRKQPPAEGRGGSIPNAPPTTTGNPWKDREKMARKILEGGTQ